MAMKILNLPYYKHNSRKEDIFYDGFFDRVNEGYVAEIFSLAFFVALALIFIITCFAMYFCGLKNCMKTCWTLFCSRQATTQAQPPAPILSNFQPLSLVPFTPQDSHMFRESRRGGDRPRLAIQWRKKFINIISFCLCLSVDETLTRLSRYLQIIKMPWPASWNNVRTIQIA